MIDIKASLKPTLSRGWLTALAKEKLLEIVNNRIKKRLPRLINVVQEYVYNEISSTPTVIALLSKSSLVGEIGDPQAQEKILELIQRLAAAQD